MHETLTIFIVTHQQTQPIHDECSQHDKFPFFHFAPCIPTDCRKCASALWSTCTCSLSEAPGERAMEPAAHTTGDDMQPSNLRTARRSRHGHWPLGHGTTQSMFRAQQAKRLDVSPQQPEAHCASLSNNPFWTCIDTPHDGPALVSHGSWPKHTAHQRQCTHA